MGLVVLGVPVVRRYDLLPLLLESAGAGSRKPDQCIVVDNGGRLDPASVPADAIVDTPGRNVGVAGAWNTIAERSLLYPGNDLIAERTTLIIANDDVVLGKDAIADLVAAHQPGALTLSAGAGMSLFAMDRATVQHVGWFDENFFPAYCEDYDYWYRCTLSGIRITHVQVALEHRQSSSLECLDAAQQVRFHTRVKENHRYYRRKWGGPPGKELFQTPFGEGRRPEGWRLRAVTYGDAWPSEPWL